MRPIDAPADDSVEPAQVQIVLSDSDQIVGAVGPEDAACPGLMVRIAAGAPLSTALLRAASSDIDGRFGLARRRSRRAHHAHRKRAIAVICRFRGTDPWIAIWWFATLSNSKQQPATFPLCSGLRSRRDCHG